MKKEPLHAYKRLLLHDQYWDFAFLIALANKGAASTPRAASIIIPGWMV